MGIRRETIKVYDMTCTSCERRVERTVKKVNGILDVKASFSGQFADIEFDDELCSLKEIKAAIQSVGYGTENPKSYKLMGIMIVVAAVVLLGMNTGSYNMEEILNNASYAVLFVVGLITSVHCVGMCGGIMLSQSIRKESKNKLEALRPAILYNLGRVAAYTILGGVIGAVGSVFALSLTAKAGLQLFAGIFMIMMGFNMAGFKFFRKIQIPLPKAACNVMNKRAPFVVGLLNGFMPCGPLQTMQIFALGTGSVAAGALSMFMFSIGTVPLMLTFGALSGLLSKGYTKQILKFSGVLIIMLGLIMSNRGLALAGMNMSPLALMDRVGAFGEPASSTGSANNVIKATIQDGIQVLNMSATLRGYTPNTLYVQKGIPVKWVIDGEEITGCNNAIVVPDMNIEKKLQSGDNLIEFTPGESDVNFSCWMGMKRGVIKVVDDLNSISVTSSDGSGVDTAVAAEENSSVQSQPSIYGDDMSKVATERLIKKAQLVDDMQTIGIKGIGYELDPLVMVANLGMKTKVTFDLSAFDSADGYFLIMNSNTRQIVTSFNGTNGIVEVEFTIDKAAPYAIYLNEEELIGLIEVVDDLNSVDLEAVRGKYLK
ncbi:sulfite exporter TauE/SafE family protein [Bacillus sp. MRMR6]|uniref:urease accessory protein UreH domain-containing protein n=1 Tax=Bacillus sp. MRMR6 TaxID=1928617 RepID=UPI000952F268|nr:sulfite exporter TauE/SafE family protein [Bacillus sp. MRMR6]OLS41724.1 heavy metal transport/detoxification protein [Bacillus sp. MRMR6]